MAAPDYESVVDEESGQPSQVGHDEWDQPEAPAPRERITIELRPKEAVPNGRHQPEEEAMTFWNVAFDWWKKLCCHQRTSVTFY